MTTSMRWISVALTAGLLAAVLVGGLAAATPDTEQAKLTAWALLLEPLCGAPLSRRMVASARRCLTIGHSGRLHASCGGGYACHGGAVGRSAPTRLPRASTPARGSCLGPLAVGLGRAATQAAGTRGRRGAGVRIPTSEDSEGAAMCSARDAPTRGRPNTGPLTLSNTPRASTSRRDSTPAAGALMAGCRTSRCRAAAGRAGVKTRAGAGQRRPPWQPTGAMPGAGGGPLPGSRDTWRTVSASEQAPAADAGPPRDPSRGAANPEGRGFASSGDRRSRRISAVGLYHRARRVDSGARGVDSGARGVWEARWA